MNLSTFNAFREKVTRANRSSEIMQSAASGGTLATALRRPRVHGIGSTSWMGDRMDDGEQQYPKSRSNGGHAEGMNSIAVVAVRRIMLLYIQCAIGIIVGRWMDAGLGAEL